MKLDLLTSPACAVFTTRDYALAANLSLTAASHQLSRLQRGNSSIVRLTRGVWANPSHPLFSPLACVPVLAGSEQCYISFLSALHLAGALSQIPASIQVATTGHTRKLRTPVGAYDFLQMKPAMFLAGVQWSETPLPFRVATIEKALLDTLYVATRKGRRFAKLPELRLEDGSFDSRNWYALMKNLELPPQIATAIQNGFTALVTRQGQAPQFASRGRR